jgi:hypothetical protein
VQLSLSLRSKEALKMVRDASFELSDEAVGRHSASAQVIGNSIRLTYRSRRIHKVFGGNSRKRSLSLYRKQLDRVSDHFALSSAARTERTAPVNPPDGDAAKRRRPMMRALKRLVLLRRPLLGLGVLVALLVGAVGGCMIRRPQVRVTVRFDRGSELDVEALRATQRLELAKLDQKTRAPARRPGVLLAAHDYGRAAAALLGVQRAFDQRARRAGGRSGKTRP